MTQEEQQRLAKQIAQELSPLMDKVMTKKQVAEYFGVSTDAIDKMCERGQIPFHAKGKHRYFSHNEILDYFLQ